MLYYKKDFHNNIDAPSVFSIHKRKKEKNDMANAKKYDDLMFTDDFMFCKVMTTNPELCHELLELILGKKVGAFTRLDQQKPIEMTADGKGIRFDVYSEDDSGIVYDCEMQTSKKDNLPKRTRYYQGMIDLNLLERGADYKELKKSYVIFICPFDQFQEGLHKYTFENQCKEIPELVLGDESTKIFLCAGGHADDVSDEMKDFLNWLTTGQTGNSQFVNKLENAVLKAKKHEEWKVEYMTLLMRDNEMMEKGRNDMLFSLVQDGTLSLEIAATKAEMPVEKFAKAMKEAGYFIRELP